MPTGEWCPKCGGMMEIIYAKRVTTTDMTSGQNHGEIFVVEISAGCPYCNYQETAYEDENDKREC